MFIFIAPSVARWLLGGTRKCAAKECGLKCNSNLKLRAAEKRRIEIHDETLFELERAGWRMRRGRKMYCMMKMMMRWKCLNSFFKKLSKHEILIQWFKYENPLPKKIWVKLKLWKLAKLISAKLKSSILNQFDPLFIIRNAKFWYCTIEVLLSFFFLFSSLFCSLCHKISMWNRFSRGKERMELKWIFSAFLHPHHPFLRQLLLLATWNVSCFISYMLKFISNSHWLFLRVSSAFFFQHTCYNLSENSLLRGFLQIKQCWICCRNFFSIYLLFEMIFVLVSCEAEMWWKLNSPLFADVILMPCHIHMVRYRYESSSFPYFLLPGNSDVYFWKLAVFAYLQQWKFVWIFWYSRLHSLRTKMWKFKVQQDRFDDVDELFDIRYVTFYVF